MTWPSKQMEYTSKFSVLILRQSFGPLSENQAIYVVGRLAIVLNENGFER